MGLPYQTEDYDEVGGGSGSVNDLGGMNFSTLDNNELMKKVDANNVGGSDLYATSTIDSNATLQMIIPTSGLFGITGGNIKSEVFDTIKTRVNITTGLSTTGLSVTSDGNVGIGVTDPEEALDIEGNIELRGGAGKIFFKHPSGLQKVEIDGDQDGTNGGKFIVKTKEDGGNMTQKLTINNIGALGIGATPNFGTSNQVLMSNGSGSSITWGLPTTNYAQEIAYWGDIKVGNSSTVYHNNNTLDQWLPLYNQGNQQQLFKSITLNDATRPVKVEACVQLLYNETTIGMRVRCNNGITTTDVAGTTMWRQSNGSTDNDTAPYTTSIVHVPNGNANVTYTIEGYVRSNFPSSNPYFFINPVIMPSGNYGNCTLLITEL